MNTPNNHMLNFRKSSYSNVEQSSIFLIIFLVMSEKAIKQIGVEYGLFSYIVKTKRTNIGEEDMVQKLEDQYLNLRFSPHDQNIDFALEDKTIENNFYRRLFQ